MEISAITGLILAGGAGSRAGGRDKGLIEHDGHALVDLMIGRLRGAVGEILISANRSIAAYARRSLVVVADARCEFPGPLAGIESGFAVASTEFVLTVPVDAARFPDDILRRLCDALEASNAKVAVAHDAEIRQALFALYRRQPATAAVSAFLDSGMRAVWRFQDQLGAIEVRHAGWSGAFANLNNPGAEN